MAVLSPRRVGLLGLVALVPVAAYLLDRGDSFVVLSAVCVLLIVGSLYLMFGPGEASGAGA